MTSNSQTIFRNNAGAAAIEFAIAAPILLSLVFGFWNAGIALFAQNGVRNAVESGARLATIFPRPTEQQIKTDVSNRYYGPTEGTIGAPRLTYGVVDGAPVVTIAMSYTHKMVLPFVEIPPIVIEHQRTAYLAPTSP